MATKRISSLMVSLVADVKKYKKGMSEAKKITGNSKKEMEKQVSSISASNAAMFALIQRGVNELINVFKVGITWAVRFGVALTRSFVSGAREMDETIKRARELGLTTSQLQKWQFAADLLGVSTKTVTRAMKQTNRRIGEAMMGYGELAVNAKQAGLNMKDFANKSTEQRFLMLTKRIAEMKDKAVQAAIAYKFGGRSLTDMINIISQKKGVLDDIERKFVELSLGVSKMVDRMGVNVENFLDNLRMLKLILQSVRRAFIITFSGPIAALLEQVQKSAIGISKAFQEASRKAKFEGFFKQAAVEAVNKIAGGIKAIGTDFEKMAPDLVLVTMQAIELARQMKVVEVIVGSIRVSLFLMHSVLKNLSTVMMMLNGLTVGLNKNLKEMKGLVDALKGGLGLKDGIGGGIFKFKKTALKGAEIFQKGKENPMNITGDVGAVDANRAASLVEKGTSAAFAAESKAIIGVRSVEQATQDTADNTAKMLEEMRKGNFKPNSVPGQMLDGLANAGN